MRKYNFIFSKLVKSDEDFTGIVAYSLYKKQKIQHIEDYKKENSAQDIPEDELEKFHKICCSNDSILGYRSRAENIINKFYNNALETKRRETVEELNSQHKKSFLYGVFQSAFGSLLYAIIMGLVLLAFWATQTNLLTIIKNILEGRQ